ncbi:uncharacterized [Tachysurus ichikawai]
MQSCLIYDDVAALQVLLHPALCQAYAPEIDLLPGLKKLPAGLPDPANPSRKRMLTQTHPCPFIGHAAWPTHAHIKMTGALTICHIQTPHH